MPLKSERDFLKLSPLTISEWCPFLWARNLLSYQWPNLLMQCQEMLQAGADIPTMSTSRKSQYWSHSCSISTELWLPAEKQDFFLDLTSETTHRLAELTLPHFCPAVGLAEAAGLWSGGVSWPAHCPAGSCGAVDEVNLSIRAVSAPRYHF